MAFDDWTVSFKWQGGRAKWAVRSAIADGLERAAQHVKRTIRRNINMSWPPASSPGEPPRRRTGNLRNNIDYWINRKTLTVHVGPTVDAEYGIYLEFGTTNMEPRPFLRPAMMEDQAKITNTINRAAAIAFRRYGRS